MVTHAITSLDPIPLPRSDYSLLFEHWMKNDVTIFSQSNDLISSQTENKPMKTSYYTQGLELTGGHHCEEGTFQCIFSLFG